MDEVSFRDENNEIDHVYSVGVLESDRETGDIIHKEMCFDDFEEAQEYYLELIAEEQ